MDHLIRTAPRLSADEERQLLDRCKNGDDEACGIVLHSRIPFFWKIIGSRVPSWVCLEDVVTDVLWDVHEALKRYDPALSSLDTYLFHVVIRNAMHSPAVKQIDPLEMPSMSIYDEDTPDPMTLVEKIRHLFSMVSTDELNEQSRLIIDRILKGRTKAEIAEELGCSRSHAGEKVKTLQGQIAWRMVDAGLSAEPYITDDELRKMAEQYVKDRPIDMF